jgi:hypothetical protein
MLRKAVMGIKFGSVIITILFLFIAKISFEVTSGEVGAAERGPASITTANSIDQDYNMHMKGVRSTN